MQEEEMFKNLETILVDDPNKRENNPNLELKQMLTDTTNHNEDQILNVEQIESKQYELDGFVSAIESIFKEFDELNISGQENFYYLFNEITSLRSSVLTQEQIAQIVNQAICSYMEEIKKHNSEQNIETQKTLQEMIKMFKVMSDKIDSLSERVNNIETRVNKLRIAKEKEDKEIQTEIQGVEDKKYTTTINMLENREKDGEILGFDDGKDYKVPEIIMIKGKTITREKTTLIPTINKVKYPNIPVSELTPRYVSTKKEKYDNEHYQEINILNSRPYSPDCVKNDKKSIVVKEEKEDNSSSNVPLQEAVKYNDNKNNDSLKEALKCNDNDNDTFPTL